MNKPRSDSKLDALDFDQQRRLCGWLLTPSLSYERVKKLVFEEFKTSVSTRCLSSFYQSNISAHLIQRRAQSVGIAKEVGEEIRKTPGQFSQKAFELTLNPHINPTSIKSIFTLVLKARDQSLKQKDIDIKLRRLQLLEKNAEAAKEKLTAVVSKGGLSPEALQEIERAAKLL